VLLEAKVVHPGRSAFGSPAGARPHARHPRRRVNEVIELAGSVSVARKRSAASRSAWASGSASPPRCSATRQVMLDEPVNGLDPEGVLWIRNLLTTLAAEGRTVFVSSHLMSEMAQTPTT
jgi:ABC-2 type transport system ATP-binding protein